MRDLQVDCYTVWIVVTPSVFTFNYGTMHHKGSAWICAAAPFHVFSYTRQVVSITWQSTTTCTHKTWSALLL